MNEDQPSIPHEALIVFCSFGLLLLICACGSLWYAWGYLPAFAFLFAIALVGVGIWFFARWENRKQHHQDREHLREMTRTAISNGHSLELGLSSDHKMRSISPLTIPDRPLTIKQTNTGVPALPVPSVQYPIAPPFALAKSLIRPGRPVLGYNTQGSIVGDVSDLHAIPKGGRSGNIMMKAVVVVTFLVGVHSSSPVLQARSNTVVSFAWYRYPITQAYNSPKEVGEDLGTPQGTPITSLVSGQLVGAGFYGGGGVVSVRTTLNGKPADFYVQHLDSIVNVGLCWYGNCGGQYVSRGELLGFSGGDCVWHYGPGFGKFNACKAHFSNGPHIEIGINPPYFGIWGPYPHPGPNYNPYMAVLALINGKSSNTITYVVRAGDDLTAIGRKYHLRWYQIYRLNKSVIGPNPNRLYPGEKLRIPK